MFAFSGGTMRELCDAIRMYGKGAGNDVAKVDMFLNHRIDTALLFGMGKAFADEFRDDRPTMILTVEASGIALAVAAARELDNIPVVFAKKSSSVNTMRCTLPCPKPVPSWKSSSPRPRPPKPASRSCVTSANISVRRSPP